jgi:hypothetical protein
MANQRQMHLAVFWLGTGNHSAGWRMPNANFSNSEWSFAEAGAQMAERGKFDLFFVGDAVAMQLDLHPSFITRFEPTTLLAGLARYFVYYNQARYHQSLANRTPAEVYGARRKSRKGCSAF